MENTHWRKILESEYLAGTDLDDGNGKFVPIVLTIKSAGEEEVRELGTNKKESCLVIHFSDNKKPMITNVTNAKAISKVCNSSYIEDWAGHRITIGTEKVKAFGEMWDALRVRPVAPQVAQKAPTQQIVCTDCKKPIQAHEGVPADKLAGATSKKYGRALCYDCALIEKGKAETATDSFADQMALDETPLPFDNELGGQP